MFKLWGDFDEDNDNGLDEIELKVMNENRDASLPGAFKQSAEKKEIDSII